MEKFSSEYWEKQYIQEKARWDIGYVSTPLKTYFDQLENRDLRILVPGAGNAYEVEYLFNHGFQNTYLLDFSPRSISNFLSRCPNFPKDQIIRQDFFRHQGKYDLIVEQTFFSSIPRSNRGLYASKIDKLLNPGGKLVGLLFNHEFEFSNPPFGGSRKEYEDLFSSLFTINVMETAHNSIKPRANRELFLLLRKN